MATPRELALGFFRRYLGSQPSAKVTIFDTEKEKDMKNNKNFLKWLKGRGEEMAYLLASDQGLSYEDYREWCEENDVTPAPEGSSEYYDWEAEENASYLASDIDNLKYALRGRHFVVIGKLGLWWGSPVIMPEVMDDIEEVVRRIGEDSIDARYDTECMHFTASHHDGTNCFRVYIVKPEVDIEQLQNRIDKLEYDFDPQKNSYDYRWFEKITDWLV